MLFVVSGRLNSSPFSVRMVCSLSTWSAFLLSRLRSWITSWGGREGEREIGGGGEGGRGGGREREGGREGEREGEGGREREGGREGEREGEGGRERERGREREGGGRIIEFV